jgi:hypothetical protein
MKKSRFTEEQITFALRQVDLGTAVVEVCRQTPRNGYQYIRLARFQCRHGYSSLALGGCCCCGSLNSWHPLPPSAD